MTYAPIAFDASHMTGQDFATVPANTALTASGGLDTSIWNHIFGNTHTWFSGQELQCSSSAANGWPSWGIMQLPDSATAGFGGGSFIWRQKIPAANKGQGPGWNPIMWPADNDKNWPASDSSSGSKLQNIIGENDIYEGDYGSNGTGFTTMHWQNTSGTSESKGATCTYPSGDETDYHDYVCVWVPGVFLGNYIDGVLVLEAPAGMAPHDGSSGGTNYTLGFQMAMQAQGYDKLPTVQGFVQMCAHTPRIPEWAAEAIAAAKNAGISITTFGSASTAPAAPAPTPPAAPVVPVAPTPVAPTTGTLTITAAEQVGTRLSISFQKQTGAPATLSLSGAFGTGGLTSLGVYWDACPDGNQTMQPFWAAVPPGLTEIELSVAGSSVSSTFKLAAAAAPSYTLAEMQADIAAAIKTGPSSGWLAPIQTAIAKFQAGNPGQ